MVIKKMELIVTADDFGYSPKRDDVIIDCFTNGILTGASLMVNGASAKDAVEKGQRVGLCMGLHFNLSEGIPISNPSDIPSLIMVENGITQFRGKEGFIYAATNQTIQLHDVETELRAQIDMFITLAGHKPSYVDGHQHIHTYPYLAETIARVLQEYGITKTRFPSEDMDEVGWMNDNPRKPFRQVVYQNSLASFPIYNRYGICGGYGIGSSIGGGVMTVQRIINCCLRYPHSNDSITTIELMTHPGTYEDEPSKWGCGCGCDGFSQHPDRVHEHEILTDPHIRQYLDDKNIKLCSYDTCHCLCIPNPNHKKRVIMMLSLKEGTGNTITGIRIANHLMTVGYCVQMVDTTDLFTDANLHAIMYNRMYNATNSELYCLFCIHAVRSGQFAYRANFPYIMMMGGTDINVNVDEPAKYKIVHDVLANSKHIIAFTEDMKKRAVTLLQDTKIPPITVMSQSTELPRHITYEIRESLHLSHDHRIVLLPSGIRRIKDINYILPAFSVYHQTHPNTVLCIMGPILDANYAYDCFSHFHPDHLIGLTDDQLKQIQSIPCQQYYEGVYYMAPIPHSRFLNALLDVDIMLNTSISEGLAAVVLEAWSAGKVIVARNNSGNVAVIKEGVSGLLFDTPEKCISIIDKLLSDDDYRKKMELSSKEYYTLQGLFAKEEKLLESILQFE